MSDYTVELFRRDYEKLIPLLKQYQEKQDQTDKAVKPEYAVLDMVRYFAGQYGNTLGTDYQMRFLSVMQFIEHYQKELIGDGLLPATEEVIHLPDSLLNFLLGSIRPPQPPNHCPSSPLYNKDRQFNYKKVVKALRTGNREGKNQG